MADRANPPICPIMRELIGLVARHASPRGPRDQEGLIDRLTELEAEALRANAPSRTLEAIRMKRRQVWVDGLAPKPSGLRGH